MWSSPKLKSTSLNIPHLKTDGCSLDTSATRRSKIASLALRLRVTGGGIPSMQIPGDYQ